MAFDFKKEYKQFYLPKAVPELVTVPPAHYISVDGAGDPNQADGAYQQAVAVLYAVAYTLKMSHRGPHHIDGFFEYVVPPLEGFWWQEGTVGVDYRNKSGFHWRSVLRLPDFVTQADFDWAVAEASRKKQLDCSGAALRTIDEGLCVQMLHVGSYDDEPATVAAMDAFIQAEGYEPDFSGERLHHEIYLSDPRKTEVAKQKTVIRHPVRATAATKILEVPHEKVV